MQRPEPYQFDVIGIVHSPYTEKFGIPRQPGLVTAAQATLELLPPYNRAEAVKGLEAFSHIWLTFVFHGIKREQWRPTVRPPRLGGNERLGVFATRSTHRPNPVGLSVVELVGIDCSDGKVLLRLKGADLLDGTPVLDIKPYIPYVDSIPGACAGFAAEAPPGRLEVAFGEAAKGQCRLQEGRYPGLETLIAEVLAQDPRPAYQTERAEGREYGFCLYDLNIRFRVEGTHAEVLAIETRPG
jgi:tRNA-Thr(GGU) m(6)t(6)A37 methyltransferase TsaA